MKDNATFVFKENDVQFDFCNPGLCLRLEELGIKYWGIENGMNLYAWHEIGDSLQPAYLLQQAYEFLTHQHKIFVGVEYAGYQGQAICSQILIVSHNGNTNRSYKAKTFTTNLYGPYSFVACTMRDIVELMIQVAEESL